MASMTIFQEGTKVEITAGDFKGLRATIIGWHVHTEGGLVEQITYAVMLDQPVTKLVERVIDVGGRKFPESEEVTFTRVEIGASQLKEG